MRGWAMANIPVAGIRDPYPGLCEHINIALYGVHGTEKKEGMGIFLDVAIWGSIYFSMWLASYPHPLFPRAS
jgi:hypothetical protein